MPDVPVRGPAPWGLIALAWLVVAGLLLVMGWQRLSEWRFLDPDDELRVVQVRDLLAGQPWFDLHQYRINPGESPVMHWSRIVDVPLVVPILLLTPLVGQTLAEGVTLLLVPLLTLGLIMAVVGRMTYRLFGKEIAGFACLACALSPLLLVQLQPMRVDHHGWQISAFVIAVAALMNRRQWLGSAIAGLAIAVGLSISLELLPLAAAIAGVMLLRGLRDRAARWWLPGYLMSLSAGLVVLFALTRGFADLTQYCDAVSPAHLLFFAIVALASAAIARWKNLPGVAVLGLLGCAGGLGVAVYLWQAPNCLTGPFGSLDPLVRQYWYLNVLEGRPVWVQPLDRSVPIIAQTAVALAVTIHLWRNNVAGRRGWWLEYGLLLGAAILGGLMVWRSMAFVGALAALPNGWLIHRVIMRYRSGKTPWARIGVVLAAIVALVPGSPAELVRRSLPQDEVDVVSSLGLSQCELSETVSVLDRLEPATIFAPIDIGPSILETTRHSVVATGHHRSELAMRDVILAYTSADDSARAIISRHGAQYLVICTDLVEPNLYASEAPGGLMSHLLQGRPPSWLRKVPVDAPATFEVWRVVD